MAEQIPFSIAENLLMKLGSIAFQEIELMHGVRGELRKLQEKLSVIKAVLVDAEEKQKHSNAVANWVERLKDVVYDADDLFDDFATEDLRRKIDVQGRFSGQVSDFFSSKNHLAFRSEMGHRIKGIRERIDDIANDISKFGFIAGPMNEASRVGKRGRETCSVADKTHKIVGRDENKKEIVELLKQSSSHQNLSTVVIVGMGGLGKTTLAQLVYNDPEVAHHFHLKIWVCVSDNFDVKLLITNILKSATAEKVEDLELDALQKLLHGNLDRKRYLLVLDDVWNEEPKKWAQLRTLLPDCANGSKILVTARSKLVASAMKIHSPYALKGLKEDESWDLFESLAFEKGEEKMHPNLVAIGKEIVKMCGGLPLLVETLGRLLYFKTQESQWQSIKDNKDLMLLGDGNDVLPVLRLSYDSLPLHLKQCFTYCALFPKDYRIEKELVVQLWIAQGYIQSSDENENLENLGDECFDDLLSRSLFQEAEKDDYNNIISCKMHDSIHDLAQSIVKSEVVILTNDMKIIPEKIRHISSSFGSSNDLLKNLTVKPIRTIFVLDYYFATIANLSSLKHLRVIRLRGFSGKKALASLPRLNHLRYLDLSYGEFEVLPNGITKLKHLRTLKLSCCVELKELPRNMKKMISLRHLDIDECNGLTCMPHGLGELSMLQTLTLFVVGNENKKGIGRLRELKCLDNLRGELTIKGFSNATGGALESKPKEAILKGKQHLRSLKLVYEDEPMMEGLEPHPNLKELIIEYYRGERFPSWMMNDGLGSLLPNLISITLRYCGSCQVLPSFGQLPSLQYLELKWLHAVEYMKDYPSSATPFFPSLKNLCLSNLHKLKEWGKRDATAAAEEALSFPRLSQLSIQYPPTLTSLALPSSPSSSCLFKLNIEDCPNLTSLALPSSLCLFEFQISYCQNLTSLALPSSACLSQLTIANCHNLTSLALPSYACLSQLTIAGCHNLTSLALHSSPCLSQLTLSICSKLTSLALHSSPCLLKFQIRFCHNLTSLALPSSPCLSQLTISQCPNLTFMQLSPFPCLEHLFVMDIPKEQLWKLIFVTSSLKELTISDMDFLISLPEEGVQHLSTLQSLTMVSCSELSTLPQWIANLTSLTELSIEFCKDLTSLPEEMRSLCNVRTLRIIRCPYLRGRCKKDIGEDWPKISHIPEIIIE